MVDITFLFLGFKFLLVIASITKIQTIILSIWSDLSLIGLNINK